VRRSAACQECATPCLACKAHCAHPTPASRCERLALGLVLDGLAGVLLIVMRRVSRRGARSAVGGGIDGRVGGAQLLLQGLVALAVRLCAGCRRSHCCHWW
jgi:hypothetical protein